MSRKMDYQSTYQPPDVEKAPTKKKKKERDRSVECFKWVFLFLIGLGIYGVIVLAMSIPAIVVGATKDCDVQGRYNLKVWLIVYGSTGLLSLGAIVWFIGDHLEGRDEASEYGLGATYLFKVVWVIVGAVWVYGYDTGDNYQNCDRNLYLYTFWLVTIYLALIGISLLMGIVSLIRR